MNQVEFEESGEAAFWEMVYEQADPECKHPLPGDWEFGGATGEDPRADPRWRPVTYLYMDRMLRRRHITQEPRCSHEAIGSYRERIDKRWTDGYKTYFITAAPDGREASNIYADTDGAFNAGRS